jgi:GR25 family glycosyltransferase involved in LPS biosynthesis
MTKCFQIFHIDNDACGPRHRNMDQLVKGIENHFANLRMPTIAPSTLLEAEQLSERLNLKFEHTQEDRKTGKTGFMKGEIGVWLSTILTLREFLKTDFEMLLILEDDVCLERDGINIINEYIQYLPKSFDFFFLYTPENQYPIYGRKKHIKSYLRKKYFFDDPDKMTTVYQHWSCAAYLVSRKGAKKFLKSIDREISLPVDWHILRGKFRSFSFKPEGPKPFRLIEMTSTIQNDRKPGP